MNRGLRDSADAVWAFWPLVLCVGLGRVLGSTLIWEEFLVLEIFILLSITILIYGRIVSNIVPGTSSSSWEILKENGLNYVVAIAIIGAPQIALRILAGGNLNTLLLKVGFGTLIGSVFGVLTIYVLPIVFIKKSSLTAVLAGVVFLWKNLAASSWIAGVVVFTYVMAAAGAVVFRADRTPGSFVIILVTSVVGSYLNFVVFAAATRILLEGAEQEPG